MGDHHDCSSGHPAVSSERCSHALAPDPLSDVLQAVRLTGAIFFLVDAACPWAAEAPDTVALAPVILPHAQHVVSYHIVTAGQCWCRMNGSPPVRLDTGDVVVVPHGDAYVMSSPPGLETGLSSNDVLAWFRQMAAGELPFVVREGGDGPEQLRLVCGFLGCDALPFNPVLGALPRMLHVRGLRSAEGDRLNPLIDLAVAESKERRAGSRSVLQRVAELMFVEVVRRHLNTLPAGDRGWLSGLRDPLVGHVLALLHRQPDEAWTLDRLAREAATSRSVLAERFTHVVGQPPMQYLARWRMQIAARLLADDSSKVGAVGREVGYDSEAAFSRAFKKVTGVSPAGWRDRRRSVSGRAGLPTSD